MMTQTAIYVNGNMASIYPRKHKHKKTYMCQLNRKGYKTLSITFDTEQEAIAWAIKNEDAYFEDPDKYNVWLRQKRIAGKMKNGWSPYEI